MAHRLELIFSAAMKKFTMFKSADKLLNRVYSFYSRSAKRTLHLDAFVKEKKYPKFRLSHIIDVR